MAKIINDLLRKSKELIRPRELQKSGAEPAGAQKERKKAVRATWIVPQKWSDVHSINKLLRKLKELIRPLELQKSRAEPAGAQKEFKKSVRATWVGPPKVVRC